MGRRARVSIVFIILLAAATGCDRWSAYRHQSRVVPLEKETFLDVPEGAELSTVISALKHLGCVEDTVAFRNLALQKNYTSPPVIHPGKYKLTPGMTFKALIDHLRYGNGVLDVNVTFNNVRFLDVLAGKLCKNLSIDSVDMLAYLEDPATRQQYGFKKETFIGMFIPNTYAFNWTAKKEEVVKRLAQEYKKFWNEERKAKCKKLHLTQSEVSTIASIVREETHMKADKPKIAGVYLNRIRRRMPLQADPTLKFALGNFSIKRLLNKDKKIKSPYNTYLNSGIPPGPIGMPEPEDIDAVLDAERHEYLYFCAKEDFSGYSNFAKTYAQHLVNARKYQKALNNRKIYR